MKQLWGLEPVRIIGALAAILSAIAVELGADAPRWLTLVVVAVVVLAAELGRSQVTPVSQL